MCGHLAGESPGRALLLAVMPMRAFMIDGWVFVLCHSVVAGDSLLSRAMPEKNKMW